MKIKTSAILISSTIALGALAQVSSPQPEVSATSPKVPQGDYQPGTELVAPDGKGYPSVGSDGKGYQKHSAYGTAAASAQVGWTGVAGATPALGQVSVLCFKQPDAKEIGETMEDVATLSFLLSRNLQHAFASDTSDYKLGIPMLLTTGNQGISASYVQGFGAILKMQVRFPVAGIADEGPQTEPTINAGSEWEQARRELMEGENPTANSWDSGENTNGREPYDSKLVHTLEKRILVLLKNASNIRHIGGNEWIITKVVGTPNPSDAGMSMWNGGLPENERQQGQVGQTANLPLNNEHGSKAGKKIRMQGGVNQATVMTLRVKKSDADAFAAGSLSQEQFIKSAEVAAYFNPVRADVSDDATWGNMANGAGFGGLRRK